MAFFQAPFKEWIDAWKEDVKIFFTRWDIMKKERHNLHYFWSMRIAAVLSWLGYFVKDLQFKDIGIWATSFILAFLAFFGNAVREQYVQSRGGKNKIGHYLIPFDWRDCRMGAYGGFQGSIIGYLCAIFIDYGLKNWL